MRLVPGLSRRQQLRVASAFAFLFAFLLTAVAPSSAQSGDSVRVYECNLANAQKPLLLLTDNATSKGALISNVQLITMHNGIKAVTFSARYAERLLGSGELLKVRYTVSWSDDCGRPVNSGSNVTHGFVLNPGQTLVEQSTALTPDASRAHLNLFVESEPLLKAYPQ
ncbi:MAG TPA: hypothetical protein DIS96_19190 [Pusillimonas sp.]|nr:hypothetical protein [Pusillimonas sp.]